MYNLDLLTHQLYLCPILSTHYIHILYFVVYKVQGCISIIIHNSICVLVLCVKSVRANECSYQIIIDFLQRYYVYILFKSIKVRIRLKCSIYEYL